MSEEAITKIPGTTFSLKFGIEGKYYSVYLCRGSTPFRTKELSILRGTSLDDLHEEVENSLRYLLDSEEVFLSPVIVDRVVNDLMDQIPKDGQVSAEETAPKAYVATPVGVAEIISKKEAQAGKKSVIEYTPGEKPKFDATADSIGKIPLKAPKALPRKDIVSTTTTSSGTSPRDNYMSLDEKITALTNELQSTQEMVAKTNDDLKKLKKQVTTLKKTTKELKVQTSKKL
ncbi:MAG: hypothetical protein ACTSSH_06035 [Candidatus Heimdallarchaeota archaeon]